MSMVLGGYSFAWEPDRWTIPKEEKFSGRVLTYTGAAFFSFGTDIVGKEITLEWDWMSASQFESLKGVYLSDVPVTWVPGDGYVYTVEVVEFTGEYFEWSGVQAARRQNVRMLLMITARSAES